VRHKQLATKPLDYKNTLRQVVDFLRALPNQNADIQRFSAGRVVTINVRAVETAVHHDPDDLSFLSNLANDVERESGVKINIRPINGGSQITADYRMVKQKEGTT
jgi:hypothetical protein